jgi:putative restriction endonuclease
MDSKRRSWTWEETVCAFELYCTIPSSQLTASNNQVKILANAIGRTANSVKLKIQNFKAYDPSYTADGRVGLRHGSKLDREVVGQFINDWSAMAIAAAECKASIHLTETGETDEIVPVGYSREQILKIRVGQSFFRRAVLSAYNNKCCVTGIALPELLTASHIKPWSVADDATEKTNPHNGLCLNAFHDRAFDRGFFTVTPNYIVKISPALKNGAEPLRSWLLYYDGAKITLPSRYMPKRELLEYHNDVVFRH